jgi:hypothetical protein
MIQIKDFISFADEYAGMDWKPINTAPLDCELRY